MIQSWLFRRFKWIAGRALEKLIKNKPVVQFLAMVMRLEIITSDWGGASRSKSSSWDKTNLIFFGNRELYSRSQAPTWEFQVGYPDLSAENPLSGRIWERCVLLVRSNILTCPSLWRWLMDAFVYSSARGLFSKGGDCLSLRGIFSGAAVPCGVSHKALQQKGGCFKGHFAAFDTLLQGNEPRLCLPWNIWAGISSVPPVIMRCQGRCCASRGWEFTLVQATVGGSSSCPLRGFKNPPFKSLVEDLEWFWVVIIKFSLKSPLSLPSRRKFAFLTFFVNNFNVFHEIQQILFSTFFLLVLGGSQSIPLIWGGSDFPSSIFGTKYQPKFRPRSVPNTQSLPRVAPPCLELKNPKHLIFFCIQK